MPSLVHFISVAVRFHAQISSASTNWTELALRRGWNGILIFFGLTKWNHDKWLGSTVLTLDVTGVPRCSWIFSHYLNASAAPSFLLRLSNCPWKYSLGWHTQGPNISAPHWGRRDRLYTRHRHRDAECRGRGKGGSSSTGQTVSERGRGSVTYCFTGKLPDLLGVKARSSLVYTQPWISAWNMSTSSQTISHRGGAVWAADTSRFPRTMRPIPHKCPLSGTEGAQRQRKTMTLNCSTGPQNYHSP